MHLYGKLASSNRHELHGEVIPPYDEQRCTNVRKKARLHRNVGFCLVSPRHGGRPKCKSARSRALWKRDQMRNLPSNWPFVG